MACALTFVCIAAPPFVAPSACARAQAATTQQSDKAPKMTPPPAQQPSGVLPSPPSPERKLLAKKISQYADAKCPSNDVGTECRVKALWAATQCPGLLEAAPAANCPATANGFEFEVGSIKPHKDDGNTRGMMMIGPGPDGYSATNASLRNLVFNACAIGLHNEMTGDPTWAGEAHYDVEAKFGTDVADALKKLTQDDRVVVNSYMVLQLLKDRAHLEMHYSTKEVPSYDLVVEKNGPMFKEADPTAKDTGNMSMRGGENGTMVMTSKGLDMTFLAANLGGFAGRPVYDKTGLNGLYDFVLTFVREQNLSAAPGGTSSSGADAGPGSAEPAGPTIAVALEEQLGLKLARSRGMIHVIVIDHLEKPDAN